MTTNKIFPKKEQAIILNTMDEISQIEHVKHSTKSLSPKISPTHLEYPTIVFVFTS